MATDDWPSEEQLRERLMTLAASPAAPCVVEWSGTAYRFAGRAFASLDHFTDGEGARRNGRRFTPVGGPRTVYLALDRTTAVAELDSWFSYYGVPDSAFTPRVFAAVGVALQSYSI